MPTTPATPRRAGPLPWLAWAAWILATACVVGWLLPDRTIQTLTAREYWYGDPNLITLAEVAVVRRGLVLLGLCAALGGWVAARVGGGSISSIPSFGERVRAVRRTVAERFRTATNAELAGVAVATIVGAALRTWRLDHPLEFDEATTAVFFASRTLWDAVTDYTVPNNHVLYSVVARVSTWLVGGGEFGLRLPAFLAGVLLIPASAWTARRVAGPSVAVLTACLVALWPALVAYSSLGRGYSLAALLVVLALGVGTVRESDFSHGRVLLVAVLLALAAWAVPVALMGAVSLGMWILLDPGPGSAPERATTVAKIAVLTTLFLVVLYAPIWAVQGWGPLTSNPYVVSAEGLSELSAGWAREFRYLAQLSGLSPVALVGLLVVLVVGCGIQVIRGERLGLRLLGACLAGVVVLTLVTRRELPARALTVQLPLLFIGSLALLPHTKGLSYARVLRLVQTAVLGLVAVVSLRAVVAPRGGDDPLTRDIEAAAGLREAIRASAPFVRDGYVLVVDASDGASDPARYYAKLVGVSPAVVQAIQGEEEWAAFESGSRLVVFRRLAREGEPEGRWVGPFFDRLAADTTLGTAESLGDFEELDVRLVELR